MSPSATTALARFATSTRLSDIPQAARSAACLAMLDAIACALAGYAAPVSKRVRDFVLDDRAGTLVTLWGDERTSSPTGAALVNGTAAHALDFDDVCWAMNAHPSCVLAPAAFAVAESVGASGSSLLHAYCMGFEAEGRLGEALGLGHYETGWHPTATLGTLGSTVTSGVLLGLSEDTLRTALGIACSRAAGTRLNFGTDTKPLHAGMAAEAGVTAARLAQNGVSATRVGLEAPMGLFELYGAGGTGPIRTDLDRFCLVDPGIEHKPYPSCRFTHRVIEAVLCIRARNERRPSRIVCTVDPFSRAILRYTTASTGLEAKFSMEVSVALAWLHGRPLVDTYEDERVTAANVRTLSERVQIVDGTRERETVAITFEDGSIDEQTVTLPLGHPQRPIPRGEHMNKITECARRRLPADAVEQLIDSVIHLETVPDVRILGRLLRG